MTASRVIRTALALLLLDAPLISADWFGWLGSRASDGLSYVSRAAVELEKNAATLSVDGRALTADEIEEPLLGARLAWLAYATSRRELESGLRRLGGGAELVHFAAQRDGSRPQWFLARIGTTRDMPETYVEAVEGNAVFWKKAGFPRLDEAARSRLRAARTAPAAGASA